MATPPSVIPALMETLAAARKAPRDGSEERELRHLRAHTKTTERQFRRYERRESYPPGAELDEIVQVYALTTGWDPFDLWREAIARAEGEVRRLGRDLGGGGDGMPEDLEAEILEESGEAGDATGTQPGG